MQLTVSKLKFNRKNYFAFKKLLLTKMSLDVLFTEKNTKLFMFRSGLIVVFVVVMEAYFFLLYLIAQILVALQNLPELRIIAENVQH